MVLHFSNKVRIESYGFFRGSSKEILHDKTENLESIWGYYITRLYLTNKFETTFCFASPKESFKEH